MKILKDDIPKEYHFLFNGRMFDTSSMTEEYRTKKYHGAEFNRCEKCNYDLSNPSSYKPYGDIDIRHAYKGFVNYYDYHKLILCDKCVDGLNGQPWK